MNETFIRIAQDLDEEVYERLKTALELGKWPDGKLLTEQQRETCMQAVISYEVRHLAQEQRAGYLGQRCGSQQTEPDTSDAGGVEYFSNDH